MKRLPPRAIAFALTCVGSVGCHGSQVHYAPGPPPPEPRTATATLYLLGDGGYASPGRAMVLQHLGDELDRVSRAAPERPIAVVFLGDNIYDLGAREAFKETDLAHLAAQMAPLGRAPRARGVFLPGNHDWAKGADDEIGDAAIAIQQAWLDEIGGDRIDVEMLPGDGCPGPASLEVGPDLRLVLLDTEALLRSATVGCGGPERFAERLRDDLSRNADRAVVLAAHHPMATGGPHGGNIGLFQRGPLLYYLTKKSGLSVQDLSSPAYSDMIEELRTAIEASGVEPLAFAAGHDHSLQVIRMTEPGSPRFQLVSGSASKSGPARRIRGTRYASDAHGYMRLDIGPSEARLTVFAVDETGEAVTEVYGCLLVDPRASGDCPEATLRNRR